jgi:hypothetical protein
MPAGGEQLQTGGGAAGGWREAVPVRYGNGLRAMDYGLLV